MNDRGFRFGHRFAFWGRFRLQGMPQKPARSASIGVPVDLDGLGVTRPGNNPQLALPGNLRRQRANRIEAHVDVVTSVDQKDGHLRLWGNLG